MNDPISGTDRNPAKRTKGKAWKLGDNVAAALATIGVTDDSVSKWIGAPCGCDERREKLNRLSEWVQSVAASTVEGARERLVKLTG